MTFKQYLGFFIIFLIVAFIGSFFTYINDKKKEFTYKEHLLYNEFIFIALYIVIMVMDLVFDFFLK